MKTSIKIAALTALTLSAGQALAFETEIERAGMLYINIPLSNRTSAPTIDKSIMGFRFGQTRYSSDRVGSLFTYFRTRPALFEVQFGMVGRKNAPDDVHFGFRDLKLSGISSIEKSYVNGQFVPLGFAGGALALGLSSIAATGVLVAASSSSSSSDSDNSNDATSHQQSSSHKEGDTHDQIAEIDDDAHDENEVEHEDDDDKNEVEHEDDDKAEIDDDELPGHDDDDNNVVVVIAPVVTVVQ